MKKFKSIIYIFVIVTVAILSIVIYRNISKENEEEPKEKIFSEIKYMETKIISLLNELNNIETRNYSISISEISKNKEEQNNTNSQNQTSGTNNSSSGSNNSNTTSDEDGEKYDLIPNGILTNSNQIDWQDIKGKIETFYSSIPTITLDLYSLNVNQNDILQFNKEFDNLTEIAKAEDKEKTLIQLSKLYEYMPKFLQSVTDDETYRTTIEAKLGVIKAYSQIDSGNWKEISGNVKQAIDRYSKILTNANTDTTKQQNINKVYVMLGELQSSANEQNNSAFLIKYKNILEEMDNV